MKKLKDFVKLGSISEVTDNLKKLEADLNSIAEKLWVRYDLEAGARVYPGIARSTAGQLKLLAKHIEEPIEITANICRTVFEINVVLQFCISSKERLESYAEQSATDEISIYKAIKKLKHDDTDPNDLALIDEHINQIRSLLEKHGKSFKPERTALYQMAKDVGLKEEYDTMYGIYSKYVHASAWFVLRNRDHIDLPMYRLPMQIHTQLYASDTLNRLQEIVNQNTEQKFTDRPSPPKSGGEGG